MTKKKKSILSDQRFIVLLVIIVLFAIFSFKSREFRQYTTILSMLDFSYYDLLILLVIAVPGCITKDVINIIGNIGSILLAKELSPLKCQLIMLLKCFATVLLQRWFIKELSLILKHHLIIIIRRITIM